MFGSKILEVAIGIVFIYILVSIICSTVREAIESLLKTRAAYLERGIRELLHDPHAEGLAKQLYSHPLIFSLFSGEYVPAAREKLQSMVAKGRELPSYIPSKNFAIALMDLAARGVTTTEFNSAPHGDPITLDSIRQNVGNISNPSVQRVLLAAVDSAQGELQNVQKTLEDWFDSGMDRVSGWYKRATGGILLAISFIVAVTLNIDTLRIADYLYRNDDARKAIVATAEKVNTDTAEQQKLKNDTIKQLDALDIPIGWGNEHSQPNAPAWWVYAGTLFGWIMTAFAASLGAPFWFDVLNKIMVIRSTVKPHEKSPEEGSEDRQAKPAPQIVVNPPAAPATDAQPPLNAAAPPTPAPEPSNPEDEEDGCDALVA